MAEGPDGKTIIIVKKVSGHGGHHGGAWKVAYADFVTAMMALFLVLWLVNSASVTTKQAVASYFRRPGVFELGSGTPMQLGGAGILPDTFAPPADSNAQTAAHSRIYESSGEGYVEPEDDAIGKAIEEAQMEEVAKNLQTAVDKNRKALQGLLGDVEVKLDQRGLHLEIMDTPKASMFEPGRAEVLPDAEKALTEIANIIREIPNPIDIEGHTDAKPFRNAALTGYDNWSLSLDRANEARRILMKANISELQVARVAGYADRRPKNIQDPMDPANRRISISMRYSDQAARALTGKSFTDSNPADRLKAQGVAVANSPSGEKSGAIGAGPGAQTSNQPISEITTQGGLKVEVGTHLQEGTVVDQADAPSSRPVWIEKDKIFGDENPFVVGE